MTTAEKIRWNSGSLLDRLRRKYDEKGYAVFAEVPTATGFDRGRVTDALVMGLWPSRGLELEAFEIKISRGDWLRERKQPDKSDGIFQYVDRFWLLAPEGVLDANATELPPTWGWMVPKGTGLTIGRAAPKLEPKPIDRPFLAAIARKVHSGSPAKHELAAAVERARQDGVKQGKDSAKWSNTQLEKELADVKSAVAKFEQLAGVKIDTWDIEGVAERWKKCVALNNVDVDRQLEYTRGQLKRALEAISKFTP